uniref:Uncharacterized protein n=1 Tax=Malurus cyaneus samueli TaxID=2593467 RepID=A0A8C5TYS2_9PASS
MHWGDGGPPDPSATASSPAAHRLVRPRVPALLGDPAAGHRPAQGPAAGAGRRGAGVPRQSASEREKLRMRRLAQACCGCGTTCRPRWARRPGSPRSRPCASPPATSPTCPPCWGSRGQRPPDTVLCPRGLGCCQDAEPRDASLPGAAGWGSPPVAGTPPELHGAPGMGTGTWGSPPHIPATRIPPDVLGVSNIEMETWGSPPYIPAVGTSSELSKAVVSTASPWLTPPHCAGAPPDLSGDPLLDMGPVLSEFMGTETVTQDLSADLLSLLEALLPPQPRH